MKLLVKKRTLNFSLIVIRTQNHVNIQTLLRCAQCKRRQNVVVYMPVIGADATEPKSHDYTSFVWRARRCSMTSELGRQAVINRFGQSQSQKRRKAHKKSLWRLQRISFEESLYRPSWHETIESSNGHLWSTVASVTYWFVL